MAVDGWTRMPLGDFVTLQRGHDLPDACRRPGRVPILGSFGITGWHDESRAFGPGVTVGRSGASFGVVSHSRVDYWPLNTALYVVDFHENDERFAYYFLKHFDFQSYNSGSAQPSLNRNFVHPVPVAVPPLREQRAIAHILGTLEDKIELNRRMSETLEAIARALFKSWFVDFDPVRAKAEGRDPVLPKPLADLFPSSFEKFELGEIPQGWRIGALGMLGELAIGGDWGEDEEFPDAVQASCLRGVDLEHLRLSGHASAPRRWFKPSSLERREMNDRDVLVAGSGAGPTGRPLWMCTDLLQTLGPCVYSNFCKRIRCGTSAKAAYLDSWLYIMRESGEIWEYVNGTSVPNLDASSLLNGKKIPLPPDSVVEAYHDFLRPIRKMLYIGQNDTLAVLRDTLLPELISGRLRSNADDMTL
jgi:type I restriction enzyme S subunit